MLLVLGAVAAVLALIHIKSAHAASIEHGTVPETAPLAEVALVKRQPISTDLSIAGEFVPYQEIEVHAKVAGYIRRIMVDIGDRVRAGQTLAVLEVPELAAQLQGADASVKHTLQEIIRTENEKSRAEADHAALHAAAERLRQAAAARPGLIAQQELDDAMAKDRASEAQVQAAQAAVLASRQQLDVRRAARLQVSSMADYTRITAPFSGVITWRYADTGSLVQAGTSNSNSQPVVKLAEVDVLRLRIPVPEDLASSVHLGEAADVRVTATGEHFPGTVTRFTGSLDRATRTMQVEIDVPNKQHRISPGMFAQVKLQIQNDPNALTIPVQAVERANGKSQVLVVDGSNIIEQRTIRTGIEAPSDVEVTAGLHEGDRVVVGNAGMFRPGEHVRPRTTQLIAAGTSEGDSQ